MVEGFHVLKTKYTATMKDLREVVYLNFAVLA